jgi:hypothetical protein
MMNYHSGAIYTRQWVVDFILNITQLNDPEVLSHKVIVEPSCGEGAFICRIVEIIASTGDCNKPADYKNLYAYDIDQEAVNQARHGISQILVSLTSMSQKEAEGTAQHIVRQADFISASADNQVPAADVVIGNPPYIRATDIPRKTRNEYMKHTISMSYGTDIYVGFIEQGLKCLKSKGTLAFICADRWLQNKYGTELRALVNTHYNLTTIIRLYGVNAFHNEVDAYPAITVIQNQSPEPILTYVNCAREFVECDAQQLINSTENQGKNWTRGILNKPFNPRDNVILTDTQTSQNIARIANRYPLIEDAGVRIGIGIATGRDAVFVTDHNVRVEPDRLLPLFYMKDWRRGRTDKQRWLINPWTQDGKLINLNEYPATKSYFEAYRDELSKRPIAQKNQNAWYRTIDKLKVGLQLTPKLLLPDLAQEGDPIYEEGLKYPHHNCYWITSKDWDLKALGGILMSETITKTIESIGVKMRGNTLRFQAQYLRMLHLPLAKDVTVEHKRQLVFAFESKDRVLAEKITRQVYGMD